MLETAIVDAPVGGFDEGGAIWLEALPARVYHTPQYGEVPVTKEKLERMIHNFKTNVRGQEIATDFDHGMDRSKGNKASGWYRDFEIRPSSDDPSQFSLYAKIEPTDEAKRELADKQWKYFSLEWDDLYIDTTTGREFTDVIIGGGFTNRPIAKKTMPVNFSEALWEELDEDTRREFAVWSTAFVNDLPDSSFLYVESGGSKDGEGKTTPRSLRHLPYKDKSGKIDLPHLRNAIARIPQMKGLSESLKSSLQNRARKLLGGANKMAELLTTDIEKEVAFSQLIEVMDETKEWEHSEPGTGTPPAPRRDEDGSDDPAITGGWRRDPLPIPSDDPTAPSPNGKGGDSKLTAEQIAELYKLTGLTPPEPIVVAGVEGPVDHTELVNAVKTKFSESTSGDLTPEQKKFSEDYPVQWAEMQRLTAESRTRDGVAFSESVKTIQRQEGEKLVPTQTALSPMAREGIAEFHKKFAEGSATSEDFENTIKKIVEGGLVQFGEIGSSTSDDNEEPITVDANSAQGIADARRKFAEKITEIQLEGDGMDFNSAYAEASKRYPELAEAYRAPMSA